MAATCCCGVAVVREPRGGVAGCDVAQAASASTTITSAQWRAAESRIAGNPAGSTDTSINVALAAGESAPVAALRGRGRAAWDPGRTSCASRRPVPPRARAAHTRSEEHTSELQSLMRNSYAVFCLKKKKNQHIETHTTNSID